MDEFNIIVENEEPIDVTTDIQNDFLRGEKGLKGDPNTLTIGTVQKGEEASASIEGDSPNQILNLILPKGDKGDRGEQGEKGEQGDVSLEQLNNATATTKTTNIAEALTITDCAGVNGTLDIKEGKTIQEGTPTPDTPIEIRNVGDNINTFDKNKDIKEGFFSPSGAIQTTDNTLFYQESYIKVKPNTNYTISSNANTEYYRICEYNKDKIFILRNLSSFEIKNYTITTSATTEYLRISAKKDILDTLKLEKGSKATSYSEYGCGSVGVKVENKNKFDGKLELGTLDNNTGNTNNNNSCIRSVNYIQVNSNKIYTISNDKNYAQYIYEYDKNKTFIKYTANTNSKFTFTTSETTKYIKFRTTSGNVQNDLTAKFQIEEGNVATDYAEHQEKTVVFPLSQGQLLHKGDYLAEDGIHNDGNTYIFNGQENLYQTGLNNGILICGLDFNGVKSDLNINTHFPVNSSGYAEKLDTRTANKIYIGISVDRLVSSDVNGLKTYLAEQYENGTPVTVEYKLTEETITPYTPEQEQAYYELQHLLMYEGYTSIECIDEIKPDIQVTYLYNNELNKTYGKRFDELSSEINELKKQVADLTAMVLSI